MKKAIWLFLIFSGVLLYSENNIIHSTGDLDWYTSFNSALEDAQKRDTIIIVNFTGSDWCSWCDKLEADVFSKKEFHNWSKNKATLLLLDFPQKLKLTESQVNHNQLLAQAYGVQGFPTILILRKDGMLIGRTGYGNDVSMWISNVEENIKLYTSYVDKF